MDFIEVVGVHFLYVDLEVDFYPFAVLVQLVCALEFEEHAALGWKIDEFAGQKSFRSHKVAIVLTFDAWQPRNEVLSGACL